MARPTPQRLPSETEIVGQVSYEAMAWDDALAPASKEVRPTGLGWLTINELAERRGKSRDAIWDMLMNALKKHPPTVEKFAGKDKTGHQVFYYRPVAK